MTLMFMIGLELSFNRLKQLKTLIFGLGTGQIMVTAVVIFGIAMAFGNSTQASILIGASFALSSTAIVMKLLQDNNLAARPVGIMSFSILLMQDLAVVPILVLAATFAAGEGGNVLQALGISMGIGAVTIAGIYIIGKFGMTRLLRALSASSSPEWLAAFVVFFVLACSGVTYAAGLSLALGAFLAGLLIGETEFRHEVEVIIDPIKGLLLGVFFLSIGMMTNVAEILRYPVLLALSVVGIFALKAAILFALSLAFKIPGRQSAESAVYLAQPGEFALMILGVALSTHVIPAQDVQFFLLVTVVAMMLTPFLFKLAPLAGSLGNRYFGELEHKSMSEAVGGQSRVLIAGFGRVGKLLADVLEEARIPYIAFDKNAKMVQTFKAQGYRIIYGDAEKSGLWRHLITEEVGVVVVATDAHHATEHILTAIRKDNPLLPVIVRGKHVDDLRSLFDKGANDAVAETLESSLRIAQILMERLGHDADEAHSILHKIRRLEAD
jgi:CPA2 family monovalent cation:H+ antiporter-2